MRAKGGAIAIRAKRIDTELGGWASCCNESLGLREKIAYSSHFSFICVCVFFFFTCFGSSNADELQRHFIAWIASSRLECDHMQIEYNS